MFQNENSVSTIANEDAGELYCWEIENNMLRCMSEMPTVCIGDTNSIHSLPDYFPPLEPPLKQ